MASSPVGGSEERAGFELVTTDVGTAVDRLRSGGVVAVPTETVYGLGADAENPLAVARIFEIKGRPAGHPLIVHLASADDLPGWARSVPLAARALANACWPGPLTVILERGQRVLDIVTGGRPAVAVRVPSHPMTLEVLDRFGGGIAAPSANRFGRVSPTTAAHVVDDLGTLLDPMRDAILDGGPTPLGVESTIVDCTVDPPQILRPGGIPTEDVVRLLDGDVVEATGPARASGMLDAHYAPRCEVRLAESRELADQIAEMLSRDGMRVDVLDGGRDLVDTARNLYGDLRRADDRGLDVLIAVLPPARGLGHAIRDRLTKAATGSARGGRPRADRARADRHGADPNRAD
jgi:L-threonylcarbamoyladenylate synthase